MKTNYYKGFEIHVVKGKYLPIGIYTTVTFWIPGKHGAQEHLRSLQIVDNVTPERAFETAKALIDGGF